MKVALIGLLVFLYLIEVFFYYLRKHQRSKPLEKDMLDVYDINTYNQWINYASFTQYIQIIKKTIMFLVSLVIVLLNVPAYLYSFFYSTGVVIPLINPIITVLIVIVFLFIEIIFQIIITYSSKTKHHIKKYSKKIFAKDYIIRTILICLIIFYLVLNIDYSYDSEPLLEFSSLISVFTFFTIAVFLIIYVKRFYKYTRLKDSSLKGKIFTFAISQKFNYKKIYILKVAKRSNQVNAFTNGFGPFKKIVLYDTLINSLEEEEIVSVFAHEIGHVKHKDVLKILGIKLPLIILLLLSFYWILDYNFSSLEFGSSEIKPVMSLIAMYSIFSVLKLLSNISTNFLIRRKEYQADIFSAQKYSKEYIISALKKIALINMSDLNPHPIDYFINYTHPTVVDRIENINKIT